MEKGNKIKTHLGKLHDMKDGLESCLLASLQSLKD